MKDMTAPEILEETLKEVAEGFDKIQHDIPILQQIVALKPEIEDALRSNDEIKHKTVVAKMDALQEELQSVELF